MQYRQLYCIYWLGCFSSKLHKPIKDYKNNSSFSQIIGGLMVAIFWTYWCSSSIDRQILSDFMGIPLMVQGLPQLQASHMQKIISREKEDRRHFLMFISNLLKGKSFWGLLRTPQLSHMLLILSKAIRRDFDAQIKTNMNHTPC